MKFELIINNKQCSFEPPVCGDVLCESYNCGRCSKLSFSMLGDSQFSVREGDTVSLKVDGRGLFFGVIFQRTQKVSFSGDDTISVVAYDQLRYLKNKDSFAFDNMTAAGIVRKIASDYRLRLGEVHDTSYTIPHCVEDSAALSDVIKRAIELELVHSGQRFTLVDDFGRLSLKSEAQMFSGVELNCDTVGEVVYSSSIDNRVNRVKVSRHDGKNDTHEVAIANDENSENQIGILQQYVRVSDSSEVLIDKARSLLNLQNKDEKQLTVSNALGDSKVVGGSLISVNVRGSSGIRRVLKCTHKVSENKHLMDLVLEVV